jgi:ubiquinone/menaquinone biosynthesis C-methylase UbiE
LEYVWDSWYRRKLGVIEPEILRLVKLLSASGLKRVLDVGCGTGRHAVYLAMNGFETYGFDISENALVQARGILHEKNAVANLIVGDMFKPFPYEKEFFSAVVATRVIHHGYLKEIRKIAKEMNRVLAKDGFMFVQSSAWLPGEKIENPTTKEVEPRTLVWSEGEEANILHHSFTREELLGMFPNHQVIDLHSRSEHYGGWCLLTRKNG